MYKPQIPPICKPCIVRLQAQCVHTHISTWGSWHFSEGEVWDDITEVCDDCGANLDELPLPQDQELTFEEKPSCAI